MKRWWVASARNRSVATRVGGASNNGPAAITASTSSGPRRRICIRAFCRAPASRFPHDRRTRRSRSRRTVPRMRRIVLCAAALAVAAVACIPPDPGPTGLYLGTQSDIHPVVTTKAQPVTWGAAPAIDANYGGTLYAGTGLETADPRPALLPGGLEPLRL